MSGEGIDPFEDQGYRHREGVLEEAEAKRQRAHQENQPDIHNDMQTVSSEELDEQRQELLRKLQDEQNPDISE